MSYALDDDDMRLLNRHRTEWETSGSTPARYTTTSPPREARLEDNSVLYNSSLSPMKTSAISRNIRPVDSALNNSTRHTLRSDVVAASVGNDASSQSFVLLERVESLSKEVKRLQSLVSSQAKELDGFHNIVGPNIDTFHTVQVQLREEIVALRDALRGSQNREDDLKTRNRELEKLVQWLQKTSPESEADAPEVRLAGLQDRLSKAYLQRSQIVEEMKSVAELSRTLEWRRDALDRLHTDASTDSTVDFLQDGPERGATGAQQQEHTYWRVRGKEAELRKLLGQKEQLITSLTEASRQLEDLLSDQRKQGNNTEHALAAHYKKCPGCGKGQWTSPYCPITGHPHGKAPSNSSLTDGGVVPAIEQPQKLTVEEALRSGAWRKMVDVDNVTITFEEVATGVNVRNLEAALEKRYADECSRRAREIELQREALTPPSLPPDAKIRETSANLRAAVDPGVGKEMRLLLSHLHMRNDEIRRLRLLLKRMVHHGGLAALPAAQFPDAAPHPASQPPLEPLPSDVETPEHKQKRLTDENKKLSLRCSELLCEVEAKEEQLAALRADLKRVHFGAEDSSGLTATQALEQELDKTKKDLVKEKRRVLSLHHELKCLRELLPAT